jgi:hypothetical protein
MRKNFFLPRSKFFKVSRTLRPAGTLQLQQAWCNIQFFAVPAS